LVEPVEYIIVITLLDGALIDNVCIT